MNILIVRLGALGDIVHTIPAAAAIRTAHPDARIDWLVEKKHRGIIDLVMGVDRVVTLDAPTPAGWIDVVRRLRQVQYDVALDFQGLMKSAVLARASGARRVVGFSIWYLREKSARPFYSDVHPGPRGFRLQPEAHVIHKNLRLLATLGIQTDAVEFPLRRLPSPALDEVARV